MNTSPRKKLLMPLVVLGVMIMTGCSITVNYPVATNQTLPGSILPLPLLDFPLIPGLQCNLPDREDFDRSVQEALGPFLSRYISISAAELNTLTLAATAESAGDFSRINHVEVTLHLVDVDGVRTHSIPLGEAHALDGFGRKITLVVEPPVDFIEVLDAGAECGAVSVAVGGMTPERDVTFDVAARVKITIRFGLSRG